MISITDLDTLQATVDDYLTHTSYVFDVETLSGDLNHPEWRGDVHRNRVVWLSLATDGRADILALGHPNGELIRVEYELSAAGASRVADNERRRAAGTKLLSMDGDDPCDPDGKWRLKTKPKRFFTPAPTQLGWTPEVVEILTPLFFSDLTKIGHNVGFDLKSIAKHFGGKIPPPPYANTAMAGFILNSRNRGQLGLADCVRREVGYDMVKGVGKEIEAYAFSVVEKYGWLDSRYDWLLYKEHLAQLEAEGLMGLWRLEMDVLEAVVNMEMTGFPVKVDRLKELDVYLKDRIDEVTGQIYASNGGRMFNIDSTAELRAVLYAPKPDGLGIKPKDRHLTDGGRIKLDTGQPVSYKDYSVSEDALKSLPGSLPIVGQVLEYTGLEKLHSAFVTAYLGRDVVMSADGKRKVEEARPSLLLNGRIYASFRPDGAATGRFSSKDPNLQQVPSRSEDGRRIRSCFSVEDFPDMVIVRADYSQIEPRVLADLSGDPDLCKVYLGGGDGDVYTALSEPFGLTRDGGKLMFLSIAYGTGPHTLAEACGIKLSEAKNIIYNQFPAKFPAVMKFKAAVIRTAKQSRPPQVRTLLGRRIYLPDLLSSTEWMYKRAERQAFNGTIQGGAADINKVGLVRCHRAITPLGGQLVATVHDEVLALAPKANAEEIAVLVQQSLEGASMLKTIPLVAEAKIITTWAEAK